MNRLPADHARAALLRALCPHAAPYTLIAATSRDWASALFVGARHRLALALDGPDGAARAERLGRELAEMDLAMQGGFVADIQVVARMEGAVPVLGIEALTIDEAETDAISRAARRAG